MSVDHGGHSSQHERENLFETRLSQRPAVDHQSHRGLVRYRQSVGDPIGDASDIQMKDTFDNAAYFSLSFRLESIRIKGGSD